MRKNQDYSQLISVRSHRWNFMIHITVQNIESCPRCYHDLVSSGEGKSRLFYNEYEP